MNRTQQTFVALAALAAVSYCQAETNSNIFPAPATDKAPVTAALVVSVHNGLVSVPAGIAFVVNDQKAFVLDVGRTSGTESQFVGQIWMGTGVRPGVAAPDDSIHRLKFESGNSNLLWDWGRIGDAAVGRLRADKPTTVTLKLVNEMWPNFAGVTTTTVDGATGEAVLKDGRKVAWRMVTDPAPISHDANTLLVAVDPAKPVHLVAGIGELPEIGKVDAILDRAARVYQERRPSAAGEWGDFVGAIADNMNNSRVYSSDNHLLVHTVSRKWAKSSDAVPYFCWDSFFNGALGCLDDPKAARDTVRAVLGCMTADGFVPNFGHWPSASIDRSQPPVGALCVWKMHQRWPEQAFLAEVYPKLKTWHAWWMKARDGRHDGLLEWGSTEGRKKRGSSWWCALLETGWDDTPAFEGARMVGSTMNAYAVDLNALWAMDAEYLALIADELGQKEDAIIFRNQQKEMNQRINDTLWNEQLGIYCSRLWGEDGKPGAFLTRLTPMNFYPLICGAPDASRAERVLQILTDPALFWGRWKLPTLAYNDPLWPKQNYWRGHVWAPVNYLVFQGLKRYGSPQLRNEFARSSVELFMRNWTAKGVCGENYMSTDGSQSCDPNYTWGALLCLIGLENIVDLTHDGKMVTSTGLQGDLELRNVPLGGVLYKVQVHGGETVITPNQ